MSSSPALRDPRHELVVVDSSGFARTAALRIARELQGALDARGTASIALPAGPQIRACYEWIGELALTWSEVDFFFTDERCVPTEHPASAFGPAALLLFSKPRIGLDNVYRIEGERPDHETVARDYETRLPARFDLLVLELGLDGHVAGLFPNSPALAERERRVVAVEAPQKPRHRITLTPRELDSARALIVLAAGRDRAGVVRRALRESGPVNELPARLALRGTWIVDRPASSALGA